MIDPEARQDRVETRQDSQKRQRLDEELEGVRDAAQVEGGDQGQADDQLDFLAQVEQPQPAPTAGRLMAEPLPA